MRNKCLEKYGSKNHNQAASVEIDFNRYQEILDDPDLSAADKRQIIEALWQIIVQFVDLGIGIHPLQHAENASSERGCYKSVDLGTEFKRLTTTKEIEGVDT